MNKIDSVISLGGIIILFVIFLFLTIDQYTEIDILKHDNTILHQQLSDMNKTINTIGQCYFDSSGYGQTCYSTSTNANVRYDIIYDNNGTKYLRKR